MWLPTSPEITLEHCPKEPRNPRSDEIRTQRTTLGAMRANLLVCQRCNLLQLSPVCKLLFVSAFFFARLTKMAELAYDAVAATFVIDERARLATTYGMTCGAHARQFW